MFPDLLEVVPMVDDPLVAAAPVDGVAAAGNNGAADIVGATAANVKIPGVSVHQQLLLILLW